MTVLSITSASNGALRYIGLLKHRLIAGGDLLSHIFLSLMVRGTHDSEDSAEVEPLSVKS